MGKTKQARMMKTIALSLLLMLFAANVHAATARANIGATIISNTAQISFDQENQSTTFTSSDANQALSIETLDGNIFSSTTADGTLALGNTGGTVSFE